MAFFKIMTYLVNPSTETAIMHHYVHAGQKNNKSNQIKLTVCTLPQIAKYIFKYLVQQNFNPVCLVVESFLNDAWQGSESITLLFQQI